MKKIVWLIFLLLFFVILGSHVYASEGNTDGGEKKETALGRKIQSYKETFEELFDEDIKMQLSEEEIGSVRKTYMKLYKRSFDGFFLYLKERFSYILSKFEGETKGCGSILVIAFIITSFIQGANNKVVIGRHLHLTEGRIMERYRYKDEHLDNAKLIGRLVRIAMILEGLMLVAPVFKSDGVLFKNLFLMDFHDALWRAVYYSCIRLLISFLAMFIPFILAYLIVLPVSAVIEYKNRDISTHGNTIHAQALNMLDNRVILGILGVISGIVFLFINLVSWFIYLEAAGMFEGL